MNLVINIITDESGWVYDEFIEQIKKYSRYNIVINKKNPKKYQIIHYLPYYLVDDLAKQTSSTCWLSHQEKGSSLNKKFVTAANDVDVGISHSKKYATVLRDNHSVSNVMSILPGTDTERFCISNNKRANNKKLVVGHVGRFYATDRKNPQLLKKISKLPFVNFRATNGKLKPQDVPKFIQGCDLIINPSFYEGGPMSLTQSLSCGRFFMCLGDVGVANEFKHGVIQAENNDDFIKKLKDIFDTKDYTNKWRDEPLMKKLRDQIDPDGVRKFVEGHDKVWEMITTESWKRS